MQLQHSRAQCHYITWVITKITHSLFVLTSRLCWCCHSVHTYLSIRLLKALTRSWPGCDSAHLRAVQALGGEGLSRFRPKQTGDHHSGGDEGDRGRCEKQDRWGRDQGRASLCPSASLLLSLTCLLLFGSGLFVITWDQMTASLPACERLSLWSQMSPHHCS